MIGLSFGTLSFLKLFLPFECPKSSIEVTLESFDYYVFYNQMLSQDMDKNIFYLIQAGLTSVFQIP